MASISTFETPHTELASSAGAELQPPGFGASLSWLLPSQWVGAMREYVRRQRVLFELSLLNDRELSDIHLTRQEISEIFTPEFARHRAGKGS